MKQPRLLKDSYVREIIIGLFIIISIYVLVLVFWNNILQFFLQFPFINSLHQIVLSEIERKSVLGLNIMTFLGGLFFVAYPPEVLFLVYARIGYNILYISAMMIFYTLLAQLVNYGIGFFIEKKILHRFVKDRKREFMTSLKKYDVVFIVVLNILPLPADILSVLLGMMKYDLKKAMLFTFIGKVLKYVFLGILFFVMKAF